MQLLRAASSPPGLCLCEWNPHFPAILYRASLVHRGQHSTLNQWRWTFQWTLVNTHLDKDASALQVRTLTWSLSSEPVSHRYMWSQDRARWQESEAENFKASRYKRSLDNPQSYLRYKYDTADSRVEGLWIETSCLHLTTLRSQHPPPPEKALFSFGYNILNNNACLLGAHHNKCLKPTRLILGYNLAVLNYCREYYGS